MTSSMDKNPPPHTSTFLTRPASRQGHWAGWSALIAVVAVVVNGIFMSIFERDGGNLFHVTRLTLVTVFAIGGVSALALAVRSLLSHERSYIVWAGFAVGLCATTLLVAEVTGLME